MLREFLYVDVQRVRSMLSQLDEGVVESVVSRATETGDKSFGVSALGLTGVRSLETGNALEQTRSMQDLLFTVFEEAANAAGLIRELDQPMFRDPGRWTIPPYTTSSSKVRSSRPSRRSSFSTRISYVTGSSGSQH